MNDIDLTLQSIQRQDEEKHAKEMAEKLKLPYISLVGYPVAPEVLNIMPEDQAIKHQIVAYLRMGNKIRVATTHPQSEDLKKFLTDLASASHNQFIISYCSETSIRYGLHLYKVLIKEAPKEEKVAVTQESQTHFEEELKSIEDLKEKITKVSTTELLDLIFAGAVKNDASDIHIEPEENNFRLRYRIDGVLEEIARLPTSAYHQITSRIKYLAKMKMDLVHPQDGRFEVVVLNEEMDIRVATLPTSYGEAVVMRLLPKKKKFANLENLGFNKSALEIIKEAIAKPQGMILNTGPTGSGKTTTLYAILQQLNQTSKKIITIENPIEYRVEGIEQIQVNDEDKTGFLDVLRGTLRQNPDIVMIGEIRDAETANIALQAAMTGHLVLTTLHTNNAPSALARLTEMGVQPYLIAGTINLIISQRLVRRVCTSCQGKGCDVCRKTGYKGRIAIIETLIPSPEIEDLIKQKAAIRTFEEAAHKLGMKTMYEDGMEKVSQGLTTKEEVERVTKE